MQKFTQLEACVDAIIARTGKRIVLGTPLGIGKPNALLNALYRRAKNDPSIQLDLVTALSLNPPTGASELEERLLKPIRERVWPGYPRLEYLDDLTAKKVPPNIRVIEFYLRSGSQLHNPLAQQNYISSNYTHVARDMISRGVNLLMQAVAVRDLPGGSQLSLSCNPDVTLQIKPMLTEAGVQCLSVGQVNRRLPWMGNDAAVGDDFFDLVLDDPALDHEPFAVPHEPVATPDYAVGLRASQLVRDGGTLQVGIGALGDAACHALRLREQDNAGYRALLAALGGSESLDRIGGRDRYASGLYVASELISNAVYALFEDGIVRRRVYESEDIQRQVNEQGEASLPEAERAKGVTLHGAFFVGPAEFYRKLRELPDEKLKLIGMTSVAEVNRIYTHYKLERLQRRHARFINICMKVTLLGAAVSDQLADGQVVSGVGGQFDFLSMAHQLPEGRSVLLLRAVRGAGKKLESNIVWEYPHATIPRHLRDIFVTEYGVADLRGRTDAECIAALIGIADSRFQEQLAQTAKRAGKLPQDWQVPEAQRRNLPEHLAAVLKPYQTLLPRLPFGCDLKDEELNLIGKLRGLKDATGSWSGRLHLAGALLKPAPKERADVAFALRHMQLDGADAPAMQVRLVRAAHAL